MARCSCCQVTKLSYLIGFSLLLRATSTLAMEDPVLAALDLADNTIFEAAKNKTLTMFAETSESIKEKGKNIQRISLDMRLDTPIFSSYSEKWRAILSNRLDSRFYDAIDQNNNINSLREAYVSFKATPSTIIDVGRINTRYGVALGNNPTDFLGRNTVRSMSSADPESLRTNRLGNVMFRVQQYWDNAAFTSIFSPKLGNRPSKSAGSLDFGASNPRDRMLLVGSYKFGENFNPQILYLQRSQRSPQIGINLSRVLTRSTLIYTEWAGGRQALRWQEALSKAQQDIQWRNQTAIGGTWSSENELTLRLEGHYNDNANNRLALSSWSKIPRNSMGNNPISMSMQDMMASRHSALFQMYQKNIIDKYDINLIVQRDFQQNKNMGFAEIRRHFDSTDVALQWQKSYFLDERKGFEIQSEQQWQLLFSYYF